MLCFQCKLNKINDEKKQSYFNSFRRLVWYIEKTIFLLNYLVVNNKEYAIARAISFNPEIILADEPTGNLDKKNTELVSNILLDYSYKKKISLILVTHNMNLAKKCDK